MFSPRSAMQVCVANPSIDVSLKPMQRPKFSASLKLPLVIKPSQKLSKPALAPFWPGALAGSAKAGVTGAVAEASATVTPTRWTNFILPSFADVDLRFCRSIGNGDPEDLPRPGRKRRRRTEPEVRHIKSAVRPEGHARRQREAACDHQLPRSRQPHDRSGSRLRET